MARLSKRRRPEERSYHSALVWKKVLGETEGVYGDVLLDDKQLRAFEERQEKHVEGSLLWRIHQAKKKIPGSTGIVGFL